MRKKLLVTLVVFCILTPFIYAQTAIDPLSRTDRLIQQEHEETREWCKAQCESYGEWVKQSYQEEKESWLSNFNNIVWFDRVFTVIGIFAVVLLSHSIAHILYRNNLRKYETLVAKYEGWRDYERKERDRKDLESNRETRRQSGSPEENK